MGTRKTTRPTTSLPKKKRPTVSSVSPTDEENNSVSTSKKIKASAKKYFQKVKSRLQEAAVWYVDNKDKTIDEILVERWREKGECPGAKSKKEMRKSCVSAALEESEDDTPEEKQVKEALKSLLEEDPDEVYEFLSSSSSRTFRDVENEEEIQDKLAEMPEKYEELWEADKSKTFSELESEFEREKAEKISKLSNDIKAIFFKIGGQISTKLQSRSSSCSKKSRTKLSRNCQTEAGKNGAKKQKCCQNQASRKKSCLEEVFEVQEEDSVQDHTIKAELEELATQDLETGTQLVESCQIPENGRSKRSPWGFPAGCLGKGTAPPPPPPPISPVSPSSANALKHYADPKSIADRFAGKRITKKQIDSFGAARFNKLTGASYQYVSWNDEDRNFVKTNTVLARVKEFDLADFTSGPIVPQTKATGERYNYQLWTSKNKFKFVQSQWVPKNYRGFQCDTNGREYGYFQETDYEHEIKIGVGTITSPGPNFGNREVLHLDPGPGLVVRAKPNRTGNFPYQYKTNPSGGKGRK